jgi:predicted flap endonuclease-1-like 5' DNA nuclease
VTGKPVTAKPPAKPATAKPVTPRRTAAKAAAAEAAQSAGEAVPKPPKRQSPRDFDKTGNVRVLGEKADSPVASAAPAAAAAAPEPAPTPEPSAAAEPAAAAEPTAAAAPLPNYDELSVASLRARLRNLDVAQVRQLAEYERAHAARADVLSMFERRIAKLEAEA